MLLLRYVNMRDSHCVYKYLMKRGYKKIAIYGTSYIARLIYQDLKKEFIEKYSNIKLMENIFEKEVL